MVETPVDVEKNSDKNLDSVNKPKDKPKRNQPRKKAEELQDVNLADVGLKLVETEKKSSQGSPQDDQAKKPVRRKKASWAKSEKTAPKKTEKLVMVETKDKQIPAVKGVIPEKRSRKSKNKSLFGFIKGLIASDDTTEETTEAASDSNNESSQDVEGSEGNKKPYRNNRRRRNNRSRNYRSNQQNQENVNKKPEMVMVETPVDVEKNSDKNSDSVNKPKVKPKRNQPKKKAEELKDVNLADVGLKLVETEKKSNQDAPQDDQVKKTARRKKASWAKSEKTAPKKTEKLVMVETKDAPKKSTKTTKAKTSAPKKSTKKTAEK